MAYWENYSTTPASNNAAAPNGAPELMPAGGLNDSMRQLMAAVREVGNMISGLGFTELTGAGPYNMVAADSVILVNQTVGAAMTINLVTAVGRKAPVKIVDLKGDAATNAITIDGNGAETINGQTTYVINFNYGSVWLYPRPDGAGWYI